MYKFDEFYKDLEIFKNTDEDDKIYSIYQKNTKSLLYILKNSSNSFSDQIKIFEILSCFRREYHLFNSQKSRKRQFNNNCNISNICDTGNINNTEYNNYNENDQKDNKNILLNNIDHTSNNDKYNSLNGSDEKNDEILNDLNVENNNNSENGISKEIIKDYPSKVENEKNILNIENMLEDENKSEQDNMKMFNDINNLSEEDNSKVVYSNLVTVSLFKKQHEIKENNLNNENFIEDSKRIENEGKYSNIESGENRLNWFFNLFCCF